MRNLRSPRLAPLLAGLLGASLAAAPVAAQSWRTVESARQMQGEKALAVEIDYGAGQLRLAPAEPGFLYQMNVRYDENAFRPVSDYQRERGVLHLGVTSRRDGHDVHRNGRDWSDARADIRLNPAVPTRLDLQFGAGKADLELGGMSLQELKISTGASETKVRFGTPNRTASERVTIEVGAADLEVTGLGNTRAEHFDFSGGVGSATLDFSGQWSRSATASINLGMGSLRLRLPQSLGVRVQKESFLASFHAPGFRKQGDSFYSENWERAEHRLTIDIDAAFGSIDLEWVR